VTIVETASGQVEGSTEGGIQVFKGIPYAAPPTGPNRLRAARPVEPWTGVRTATEFANWAPQNDPLTTLTGEAPGAQGEDCLALNVWTPGTEGRRPVMVWIHGGAFVSGSGASSIYNGTRLAGRGDVVVVTVNYRLGLLGFLAHPDLADDQADGAAGTWGLLDQVAALRWVRDNIAAFGGDPDNVTIFGESAGGMSVSDLLAMPAARGLFRRAIVQSGPPNASAMDAAETTTAKLLAELGVTSPAAIRDLPVGQLLAAQLSLITERRGAMSLIPVVDGASLPVAPRKALADGSAKGIDLMIGTNRDEWKMFMVADPANRDPDEEVLHRRIDGAFRFSDVALSPEVVIDGYRAARTARGDSADPRELWSAIESDRIFRVGSIRAAEAQAAHAPTYMYLFTWESPAMRGALGACHALEIPFVFNTLGVTTMSRFAGSGPAADALSDQMSDAWVAFARTGNPNHGGIPDWPTYDSTRRATMDFGPDTRIVDAPYDEERLVWGSAG
jgi:para-nitrobenzyl esterase